MQIMKSILNSYDGTYSIVDYFINPSVISTVNATYNYNIQVVAVQPLLDGSITNPPTVANCPNLTYMFLNSKNSVNLSIDPTNQSVFNENVGKYFPKLKK